MTDLWPAQRYGRVAVVMGGTSAEREISLISGKAVLDGLLRAGVNAYGIDADHTLLEQLMHNRPDRVFIILHGRDGEDGKLQGALEWLGIPYTGSGVLASALAMDKVRTKLVWQQLGISTPPFVQLHADSDFADVLRRLGPCFVKPVNEGSSIGIGGADTVEQLEAAFENAVAYDDEVLAESWIKGREYSVPVLGDDVLPVIEMRTNNAFYDYEAKYLSNETQYICPAKLDAGATRELQQMVLAAYRAVGCSGWGRVDVMRDAQGRFWLLEVNTAPGMTGHSLVPMGAKAAGIGFDELVVRILHSSTTGGAHG
ncbi:MAG TPA: D-alanine--D-alanine ligase [Candidatus Acidoferrum sp.]|nr:D-alanine--D-alanine ligase [Candidatus Acidoferrum sp.]